MRWTLLRTVDGSPTLVPEGERAQAMHSLQGALSETLHVYEPLAEALSSGRVAPRAVVVGLGLGYVECVVAACALRAGFAPERVTSFESEDDLRAAFLASLHPRDESAPRASSSEVSEVMRDARAHVARAMGVSCEALRDLLFRWHQDGILRLSGSLDERVLGNDTLVDDMRGFGALFFDAYSEAASAELWSPAFLSALLACAAPQAGLATYAARGPLSRALRAHGFVRAPRVGYGRKRECTLAFRGRHAMD